MLAPFMTFPRFRQNSVFCEHQNVLQDCRVPRYSQVSAFWPDIQEMCMHLLATSPLKCYCKSTRKHHQSSALHRPNSSSVDIAQKEKQKPGQNVPDFVLRLGSLQHPVVPGWITRSPAACGMQGNARSQTEDEMHHIW